MTKMTKALAISAMLTTALIPVGAYALCVGGACPPPTNFPCAPTNFNPANPAASGYVDVFSDDFTSVGTSTIDLSATGNTGYHWYTKHPFGGGTQPSGDFSIGSSSELVITPSSGNNYNQDAIATAYPNSSAANGEQWIGTAFGGGAYFQAVFAFDGPTVVNSGYAGWPAFWSMSVEHWANVGGDNWPGQSTSPNFTHFIEDDFFEYDDSSNANFWGSGLWDWSNVYQASCPTGYQANGFCGILNAGNRQGSDNGIDTILLSNPARSVTWNTTTYHTLGALWVPGTPANGNIGSREIFFDGVMAPAQAGSSAINNTTSWTDGTMPLPASLPNSPEIWSIHDKQNVVMVLGSGVSQPFHIKSVQVWQIPGCGTVVH